MPIEAPPRTLRLNPVFKRNTDWIVRFVPIEGSEPDYPVGTTVWFRQYADAKAEDEIGSGIEGEIVDGEIRFKIESAITGPVPAGRQVRGYISYPNTPTSDDLPLFKGVVVRDD